MLKIAIKLGLPLQYTWSCILGGENPCDNCFSCIDRKTAFEYLELEDPIYNKQKVKKNEKIK